MLFPNRDGAYLGKAAEAKNKTPDNQSGYPASYFQLLIELKLDAFAIGANVG